MSEEVEYCRVMIDGTTRLIKGSIQVVQWIIQALKAMHNWKISQAGTHSIKNLEKISEGSVQIIALPEMDGKAIEMFEEYAKKSNIRWGIAPDFDLSDGKIFVAVVSQDAGKTMHFASRMFDKVIKQDEEEIAKTKSEINETEEKLFNTPSGSEEAEELKNKKENLNQKLNEEEEHIKDVKECKQKADEGALGRDIDDYLKEESVDTDFNEDPDKAVSEANAAFENGEEFAFAKTSTMEEAMQPIRSSVNVPPGKEYYYLPESGISVRREFSSDKETGVVNSKYYITTDKGEKIDFSDKNLTRENWNEYVLPKLLDTCNATKDTKVKTFANKQQLDSYRKYHNGVKPMSEKNVEENMKKKDKILTPEQEETNKKIEEAVENTQKGEAIVKNQKTNTIVVPMNSLRRENGEWIYTLPDKEHGYAFSGINVSDLKPYIQDGKAHFSIDKDVKVYAVNFNTKGDEAKRSISTVNSLKDSVNNTKESMLSHTSNISAKSK